MVGPRGKNAVSLKKEGYETGDYLCPDAVYLLALLKISIKKHDDDDFDDDFDDDDDDDFLLIFCLFLSN